jgi:hypothetical protein
MAKDRDGAMDALANNIKRQIRTEANARFLRRIPLFSVDTSLPQDLSNLLNQLDEAECSQRRGSRH